MVYGWVAASRNCAATGSLHLSCVQAGRKRRTTNIVTLSLENVRFEGVWRAMLLLLQAFRSPRNGSLGCMVCRVQARTPQCAAQTACPGISSLVSEVEFVQADGRLVAVSAIGEMSPQVLISSDGMPVLHVSGRFTRARACRPCLALRMIHWIVGWCAATCTLVFRNSRGTTGVCPMADTQWSWLRGVG